MALDLEDLDDPRGCYSASFVMFDEVAEFGPEQYEAVERHLWLTRLRKWQEIAHAAGDPDPALGFLTRLGALVNALRSIERGYPWGSIQEDFVYAGTGRAPR